MNDRLPDRLEFVSLRLDAAAVQPWGAQVADPAEAAMLREEEAVEADRGVRWGWLMEEVMVYLLTDFCPERWGLVAARALRLFQVVLPGMLGRERGRPAEELPGLEGVTRSFPVSDLQKMLAEDEGWEGALRCLLGHLYPGSGPGWLREGTRRVYVVARVFNGSLVSNSPVLGGLSKDGKRVLPEVELSWEKMAVIFGEGNLPAARARWSALAKRVVVQPIERVEGVVRLPFGKSAETREKYRAAALGNGNRRGKRLSAKSEVPSAKGKEGVPGEQ